LVLPLEAGINADALMMVVVPSTSSTYTERQRPRWASKSAWSCARRATIQEFEQKSSNSQMALAVVSKKGSKKARKRPEKVPDEKQNPRNPHPREGKIGDPHIQKRKSQREKENLEM
jgi:hypothetical protein